MSRMADFSYEERAAELREYLGKAAESMISLEAKEKKFTKENHEKRLDTLMKNTVTNGRFLYSAYSNFTP